MILTNSVVLQVAVLLLTQKVHQHFCSIISGRNEVVVFPISVLIRSVNDRSSGIKPTAVGSLHSQLGHWTQLTIDLLTEYAFI